MDSKQNGTRVGAGTPTQKREPSLYSHSQNDAQAANGRAVTMMSTRSGGKVEPATATVDEPRYRLTPEIAQRITEKRLALGWTVRDLAQKTGTWMQQIDEIEAAGRDKHPLVPTVLAILDGKTPRYTGRVTPQAQKDFIEAFEALNIYANTLARETGCNVSVTSKLLAKERQTSIWLPALMRTLARLEPSKNPALPISAEDIAFIRRERKAQGLSITELAQRVGSSRTTIKRLESGCFDKSRYLQPILDVLAGRDPNPVTLRPRRPGRRSDRKPRLPEGVTGNCRRCGTLLFEKPEDIPDGWPPENHIPTPGNYCLSCCLARNGLTVFQRRGRELLRLLGVRIPPLLESIALEEA